MSPVVPTDYTDTGAGSTIAMNVGDCQSLLRRRADGPRDRLQILKLGVLNWNMNKGVRDFWERDLRAMAVGKELVILQEAVRDSGIEQQLEGLKYSSFSQGFTTRSRTTGVVTYSKRRPLGECMLSVVEPLLRTRKATSVTAFAVSGREQPLVVVNAHVVNFSFGLIRFREQMEQIRQVLSVHEGPAILSGDFNTWRQKRMDIVDDVIGELGFSTVRLDIDNRSTFNGHALDHIFVRGLSVHSSESRRVTSSDHNPITVELQL